MKNSDFWKLLRPPLTQISKFNNFLWVCWFLGKTLSNFVPPVWNLHNQCCHNSHFCPPFHIPSPLMTQWTFRNLVTKGASFRIFSTTYLTADDMLLRLTECLTDWLKWLFLSFNQTPSFSLCVFQPTLVLQFSSSQAVWKVLSFLLTSRWATTTT